MRSFWTVILFLLCSAPIAAWADTALLPNEIERLQKLSETQHEQAIVQIEKFIDTLPATTAFSERRDLLDILLPLYLRNRNIPKIRELIEQLNQIDQKNHDLKSRALALNYQAKLFELDNNLSASLEVIEQALALTAQSNDNLLITKLEYSAGELYSSIGNFQVAIQHQQRAQSAIESVRSPTWQTEILRAKTLFLEAYLYYSINDQHTALNYLGKALEVAEQLNAPDLVGQILNSRGTSYAYLKQWNLAKADYTESLKYAREAGNAVNEALSLTNLADVAHNIGDYKACDQFAQQAINIARKFNDAYTGALALGNAGICHIYAGEFVKGKDEVDQSLAYMKTNNELSVAEITLDELSAAYAKSGMYREAWNTVQQKAPVSARMAQEKRENTANEVKVLAELAQHQKDKEQGNFSNAVQTLENDLYATRLQLYAALAALLLVLGVLGFQIYRRTRLQLNRQKISRRNLMYQTSRDPLTGLLNRRAFEGVIESRRQLIERRSTETLPLYDVVVLLEVDHFKQINDRYGHESGNEVLVEISKRMQDMLREKDMLIRWSSKEFLIYLNAVPAERVTRIIERELHEIAGSPVSHDTHRIQVSLSAGYVLLPLHGAKEINWDSVMELIAGALHIAQANGNNQACGIVSIRGREAQMLTLLNGAIAPDLLAAVESELVQLQSIAGPPTTKN